jgi:PKD repeat protein
MNAPSRRVSLFAVLIVGTMLAVRPYSVAFGQHHVLGRMEPYKNCRLCHGDTLQGLIGRSCYTCHDRVWPGGELPPVADAGGDEEGKYTGFATVPLELDGSKSTDPDGAIVQYQWDFGDGSFGEGVNPSHAYESDGNYTIILMVTDDRGNIDVATATAEIDIAPNRPPTADAGGPYTGSIGSEVQFDGSGSSDPDGDTLTFTWDFGDGTTGTGESPTHTYIAEGGYIISLEVADESGETATAMSFATISANAPPIVDPGGSYTGVVGEEVLFDASGTADPDGDVLTFSWIFGDDSLPTMPSQDPTATHVYAAPGTYTARVIVMGGSLEPVIGQVTVEIASAGQGPDPPTGTGASWEVRIGLTPVVMTVSFQELQGFLLVQTLYADGSTSMGLGIASGGVILWLDATGTVYFGNIDEAAGTMMGMVYDSTLGTSAFAAKRL